jgi:hypothetical protein
MQMPACAISLIADLLAHGARLACYTVIQGLLFSLMLGQVAALSVETFALGFASSALVSLLEELITQIYSHARAGGQAEARAVAEIRCEEAA